ncbi:hypothetical protein VB264_18365 [Arcicella aquatica]|uniref:Uncharacterized protein n=1 Tax=Arcicella aquatica TaxID=217141 RepID=A0ABU5QRQ6_9BACT|nr:hypothetical protein [Arcicella aquatica]MEA5259767.1 hypothetical protein [Arcicella aquatica]
MKIDNILIYTSSSAVLFPLIICILRKKYLTKDLKILFLYVIASISCEVLGTFCGRVLHYPNHFILNTFALSEGLLISFIFREAFIDRKLKTFVLVLMSIYTIVGIYLFMMPDGFFKFNSTVNTISCLLIITWVLIYFYQLLQTLQLIKLYTLPLFWISVGCLLYFSGTLFIFLYSDTILFQKEPVLYFQLWSIYYILLFVFRVLLAVGLWFSKTAFQLSKSFSN